MTCRLRRQEPSLTSRNEKVLASRRDLIQPAISIFASALAERAYLISVIIKPGWCRWRSFAFKSFRNAFEAGFCISFVLLSALVSVESFSKCIQFLSLQRPRARSLAHGAAFLPRECFGANALAGLRICPALGSTGWHDCPKCREA